MSELDTQVKPPTTKTGTRYVFLCFNPDTAEWLKFADLVTATSAQAAIREYLGDTNATESGTYVAIPARSWRPVHVKAEQTVTLKLEAAE